VQDMQRGDLGRGRSLPIIDLSQYIF